MKKYKGDFGYIAYRKKITTIRTVACLAVSVGIFLIGLAINGTQKNVFSIIAALGCLPAGWSAVNMIMFLRAKACNDSDHREIEAHRGKLLINYDLVITSYDRNYNVAASTVLDKNICCYCADTAADTDDIEKHIKKMMAQGGYSNYSIKVFDKLESFCGRLDQLEKLRSEKNIDPQAIEDAWVPGTAQTATGILLSISL